MQRYVPHHVLPLSSCVSPRGEDGGLAKTNMQQLTCFVLAQRRAVAGLRVYL